MAKVPRLNYDQVVRALRRHGWVVVRHGPHYEGFRTKSTMQEAVRRRNGEAVCRLLLTGEILSLPQVVRELAREVTPPAEAQRGTEQRLEELVAAQRETE